MTYSLKQSLALANKIDKKYGDKNITKTAGNLQAIVGLMGQYDGTAEFLKDVAKAVIHFYNENQVEGEDNTEAMNAAKQIHDQIIGIAGSVYSIESTFF